MAAVQTDLAVTRMSIIYFLKTILTYYLVLIYRLFYIFRFYWIKIWTDIDMYMHIWIHANILQSQALYK